MIYKAPSPRLGREAGNLKSVLQMRELEAHGGKILSQGYSVNRWQHLDLKCISTWLPISILSPLCHRTLSLVEFPQDKYPKSGTVASKSVTISTAHITYPSMKRTVKSRQEKSRANLLSTAPKDHRLFQVGGEHRHPPFFMYEKKILRR